LYRTNPTLFAVGSSLLAPDYKRRRLPVFVPACDCHQNSIPARSGEERIAWALLSSSPFSATLVWEGDSSVFHRFPVCLRQLVSHEPHACVSPRFDCSVSALPMASWVAWNCFFHGSIRAQHL
jgi:hypothetical protein